MADQGQAEEQIGKAVDAVVEAAIPRQIVGARVMVSHGGKLVYDAAAGLADREAGTRSSRTPSFAGRR